MHRASDEVTSRGKQERIPYCTVTSLFAVTGWNKQVYLETVYKKLW